MVMDGHRIIEVNGVDLCVDATGDAADPAILLISGMGGSMDWWEEEFCQRLAAAGGKNLEVFSPTIGRQLLELGLIDEIDLHILPVLLGDGIRLYDNPGGEPVRLHRVGDDDPMSAVNVRYRLASE